MIHYVVLAPYASTMRDYLDTWGASLRDQINILPYHEFLSARQLPFGTYILSDIERLTPPEAICAAAISDVLTASHGARVLNHSIRSLRRRPLLELLHARGRNAFRVWPATEADRVDRFPVFVRRERQHGGSLTPLLRSPSELRSALRRMRLLGRPLRYLLIVEFCETRGPDDLYRKYSAFLVGDRLVPRHLIFSRRWMLNNPDLLDDRLIHEEMAFLETNPHEAWIRDTFAIAGMQYGRLDYGIFGVAPQAWEINSNPVVMMRPEGYRPAHLPAQKWFAARIQAAFEQLDTIQNPDEHIATAVPDELRRNWERARRRADFVRLLRL